MYLPDAHFRGSTHVFHPMDPRLFYVSLAVMQIGFAVQLIMSDAWPRQAIGVFAIVGIIALGGGFTAMFGGDMFDITSPLVAVTAVLASWMFMASVFHYHSTKRCLVGKAGGVVWPFLVALVLMAAAYPAGSYFMRVRADRLRLRHIAENGVQACPYVYDEGWTELVRVDFAEGTIPDDLTIKDGDPGLRLLAVDGAAQVVGTTKGKPRVARGFETKVEGDNGSRTEISGDFAVVNSSKYSLAILEASADEPGKKLCMSYERSAHRGDWYAIQDRWMQRTRPTLVEGLDRTVAHGNTGEVFRKMRMVVDRDALTIDYYVDDNHLGTIQMQEGFGPIVKASMSTQASRRGTVLDTRFDNLMVRSAGD